MKVHSLRAVCVVLLLGFTPFVQSAAAIAAPSDIAQVESSETSPVPFDVTAGSNASDVATISETSPTVVPTSDAVEQPQESGAPDTSETGTPAPAGELTTPAPDTAPDDAPVTSVPVAEPADPNSEESNSDDSTSADPTRPDASTIAGLPDSGSGPFAAALVPGVAARSSVTVPTSSADPVAWTNTTSDAVLVESIVDGVVTRSVYGAGETFSIPGCPVTANECNVGVFANGGGGSDPIIYRSYHKPPFTLETGNYATNSFASGPGFAPGLTNAPNGMSYSNNTGQSVTVVFDNNTAEGPKTFVVPRGKAVTLPPCDTENGYGCKYIVGVGEYDITDPELTSFKMLTVTDVDRYGSTFTDVTGKGGPFAATPAGITYTNTSGKFEQAIFQDHASGHSTLVNLQPGDTVMFPKCTLMAGNTCAYTTGPPDEGYSTLYIEVTDSLVDGSPTPTKTPTPRPSTSSPASPGGWSWPIRGGTTPRGSTPSNNGWAAPPEQLDLCAQISGAAKALGNSQLANIGYGCSGVTMGVAAGRGNSGGFFATAIGLGAGAVANKVPYLPGVAINVWAYTAGQAAQTDWSSFGNTARYAAKNPGVVVQETVKATGVVLSNIWPAFLPKW